MMLLANLQLGRSWARSRLVVGRRRLRMTERQRDKLRRSWEGKLKKWLQRILRSKLDCSLKRKLIWSLMR